MEKILQSGFINTAREGLLNARPKSIALSGPGGFLGARVLSAILDAHEFRRFNGVEPGEVLLL